jgi:DNA polymerase-3 subunit epsilon
MKTDRRLVATVAGLALAATLLLAAFAGGGALLLRSDMSEAQRQALAALLEGRWPALVLVAGALVGLAAAVAPPLYRRWVAPPARLAEQAGVLAASGVWRELGDASWPADVRALAAAVNALAAQREALRADIARQVAEASRGVEQERRRLAALMSELTQSVVVCNLDGRVLLYNQRARLQFRALSAAPAVAAGAGSIGLGRSIYAVFDRELVAHALENLQQRLQRGAGQPTAQFVTVTPSGQLLRAQMAPVLAADDGGSDRDTAPVATTADPPARERVISGFVLMLENITREVEQDGARERLLLELTEGQRGALANLQAALEVLEDPGLEPALRERFLTVARDEARTMGRRLHDAADRGARELVTRWPLEEMRGADFVQAAARRIESATGLAAVPGDVEGSLWLKLDSYALLQAVAGLALRLKNELGVARLELGLQPAPAGRAHLDLAWSGQPINSETAMGWELDPIELGGQHSTLSVRDVVQRHGGEFWFGRDDHRRRLFFRFLLPLADDTTAAQEQLESAFVRSDSRPEYYDFDLFARSEGEHALDDQPLAALAYTVFDTETTGLDPAGGDEILQIGAVRLVNGRLLRGEAFEQLVDPQRPIPSASIPIHGITQDMVTGQPTIAQVLPAFHRYAQDTVLVAHNAAFDMRFLQLKEQSTGVRFEQPVLDTLLLSAVVHPNQESHGLEAIAERFGVTVLGRHTAMGDAMVTAEVFQKLLPLLAERGIHTLRQAREAAQKTWYARLEY